MQYKIEKALNDKDKCVGYDIMVKEKDTWEWCERFELKRWAKEALTNHLAGRPMLPDGCTLDQTT